MRDTAAFSVGWIDAMAHNGKLGRGILETAEFEPGAKPKAKAKTRSVPIDFPDFLLHPLVVRGLQRILFPPHSPGGPRARAELRRLLYPLDAVRNWNRIYGRWSFISSSVRIPMPKRRWRCAS